MLLVQHAPALTWSDYGVFMLETLGVLAAIAAAAWLAVRFGRPHLKGRAKASRMHVLERLALEPRRSLYLVQVDEETMVVGVSERAVELVKTLAPGAPAETTEDRGP